MSIKLPVLVLFLCNVPVCLTTYASNSFTTLHFIDTKSLFGFVNAFVVIVFSQLTVQTSASCSLSKLPSNSLCNQTCVAIFCSLTHSCAIQHDTDTDLGGMALASVKW